MGDKTPEQWGEGLQEQRPRLEAFTKELDRLVTQLLESADIEVAQIESRTKEVRSFVDKIYRKNEKYENPLDDITDLCGLRLICYYPEDAAQVGQLIEREFAVDWANSERPGTDSDPERFGYRSDHYVVQLSASRAALAEWSSYAGVKAEIQVRTVMQHAWAAVDHKVRYKRKDLPPGLQRRLFRLSAMLEVADDQFAAIQREGDRLTQGYEASLTGGDYELHIDALSLNGYLETTDVLDQWTRRAVDLGYRPLSQPGGGLKSRQSEAAVDKVMDALRVARIDTIDGLRTYLSDAEGWGENALRTLKDEAESKGFTPYAVPMDLLAFLLLCTAPSLTAVDDFSFRSPVKHGIKAATRWRRAAP